MIRNINSTDAQEILAIYNEGLKTRNATFETKLPSWQEWDSRFLEHSRLVFEEDGGIKGWAALTAFSKREVYRGVAEVSIYVHPAHHGHKIGTRLMLALIASSEANGIWTLFSSVFPENKATISLHLQSGFKVLGTRKKIAKLEGKWRDTIILERRSAKTGIN